MNVSIFKGINYCKHLYNKTEKDAHFDGAASLAYYWMLALFPAIIFLLSLSPYLPIKNLHDVILAFLLQSMPQQSGELLSGVIDEVTKVQNSGLMSFGALATIWVSSNGKAACTLSLFARPVITT